VQLFIPDPWHKRKHHKRRIVQAEFVSLLASRLHNKGVFHMATDWEHYAKYMAKVMQAHPDFSNTTEQSYAERPAHRPQTKFEQRGLKRGHGVWDLLYQSK
jgi:tRNA (guanine-N7-)-methyltransferase